jgi:hypothetical protein
MESREGRERIRRRLLAYTVTLIIRSSDFEESREIGLVEMTGELVGW